MRTIRPMEESAARRALPTPFVSSFVSRARAGDLTDPDPAKRSSAWAHWAVTSLAEMRGYTDRAYTALVLPGRFYDPKGKGPTVRPHLEVPAWVLERPAPDFPDRLAQAGNGLTFPWWLLTEVTAVRRAVFNTQRGPAQELLDSLVEHRLPLVEALAAASRLAAESWSVVEEELVSSPDGLSDDATGDFDVDAVSDLFPAARGMGLSVVYDTRLREANQQWASRRVGVWQLVSSTSKSSVGVVTPRLTANSLFRDPLFSPERESAAALLVRTLLLRRLLSRHVGTAAAPALVTPPKAPAVSGPHLRAVVAKVGARMPKASVPAAVRFLQTYPDAEDAWAALSRWSGNTYLLTVSHDGFVAAHANALRYVRRAEDPERDDIDVVLPLAWDQGPTPRVVRATFSRPRDEE